MTEEHNRLQLQVAIEAVKMLTPLEQFNKALALATTKHGPQVAGANNWHE